MRDYWDAVNYALLPFIPKDAKKILDVGCGNGLLGPVLHQHAPGCEVTGLTNSRDEAVEAEKNLDKLILCELDDYVFDPAIKYDCIICSHVLEHLVNPVGLLKRLHEPAAAGATLVTAVPNAMHWKPRRRFIMGSFRYVEGTVTDETHIRFFDFNTSAELPGRAGWKVVKHGASGYFPLPLLRNRVKPLTDKLDKMATDVMPNLFGLQFITKSTRSVA